MRALLIFLLLCAPALGDWNTVEREFQARYRPASKPAVRILAIGDLAAADLPRAAALLCDTYNDLDERDAQLRKLLREIRTRLQVIRTDPGSIKDPKKRRQAKTQLTVDERKNDERLARLANEKAAVLDGLRSMKSDETLSWMASAGLKRARSPLLLQTVAIQVANHGGTEALLTALARARKPEHIIPLLQAIGKRPDDARGESLSRALAYLSHRDAAIRAASAHALTRLRQPDGVEALVKALQVEPEGGRAFHMFVRALQVLTGQRIGPYADVWKRWWNENKEDVRSGRIELGQGKPITAGDSKGGRFYGIPQVAPRIIYVLDASGSMEADMVKPKFVNGNAVPAEIGKSRLAAARRELLRAVKQLRKGTLYAVIFYSSHADPVTVDLVEANEKNYRILERKLDDLEPGGPTNIYAAMDLALRMANVHPDQARGKPKADAIYLVSDGSPTNADGKPEGEAARTQAAVKEWNALNRVVIHTIGIGRQHNAGFLRTMAEQNDGEYYAVRPKRKR